ncbi:hypothetical protein [Geminocystis herdmanii]|uniref:hypothetical protein n=1 Tax=Geminocystis herdmanii TaxID=669359 RepID=UPI000347B435|nr:hypothetical protein [Geminocystis herdmanii]
MLSKISRFVAIATLTTLTCVITNPTSAKPVDSSKSPEVETVEYRPMNMSRLVNEAFSTHSGNFFEGASLAGQIDTILGMRSFPQGSFPENNITNDALLLNVIMYDYFRQLKEGDPTIRTEDLPNPFDTSLREIMDDRQ